MLDKKVARATTLVHTVMHASAVLPATLMKIAIIIIIYTLTARVVGAPRSANNGVVKITIAESNPDGRL